MFLITWPPKSHAQYIFISSTLFFVDDAIWNCFTVFFLIANLQQLFTAKKTGNFSYRAAMVHLIIFAVNH